MAQLAKIGVISAPACPGCSNRLDGMPLDELVEDPNYQCPFCGEHMRIPEQVLTKLIQQRDDYLAAHGPSEKSILQQMIGFFSDVFKVFFPPK